jgi:hypothetical protein
VVLALALTGCQARGAAEEPAAGAVAVAVAEILTAPAVDPDGIVFSVALRNDSAEPAVISEVTAVADEGVGVDILGASTCQHGCAGALPWREAEAMMERSIEWPEEFAVPAESAVRAGQAAVVKVVMRVYVQTPAAQRRLEHSCLFVRELHVRVGDQPPQRLGNRHADFVVALDSPDPGVPSRCPLSSWAN